MSPRTTAAPWVLGMIDAIVRAGLDAHALCAEAGIDIDALVQPNAKCSTEKINLLWKLATQRSRNPAIALVAPEVVRPACFDVVGYAMMSAPSLHGALERLARYLRILSDATSVTLSRHGEEFHFTYDVFSAGIPAPQQRFEFGLITCLSFFRWIAGREVRLHRVMLSAPAPRDLQPYRDAFRCPLQFAATSNTLVFSLGDLDFPLPTSNAMLSEMHDRFAGQQIESLAATRTTDLARVVIIRRLPEGEPTRDQIASDLCLSARTMQRRFADEGRSFHDLLDEIRRELAERYMRQQKLSLSEAAYLLGFASQGNFTRAFKRWFDLAPRQYRAQLTG